MASIASESTARRPAPKADAARPHARRGRAARAALLVACVNLALSVAWILLSSSIAARVAGSVQELQTIEQYKGLGFVFAMSALLGFITWCLLRRVERQQAELEQHRAALVQSEGRAVASLIASAVAHDMNNVLGIAFGQIDLMRLEGQGGARLDDVDRALDRLAELAKRMQSLGKAGLPAAAAPFDLAATVRDALDLVAAHPRVRDCTLTSDLPDTLPFSGSEAIVTRIVTNLLLNAGEATDGRGQIRVRLSGTPAQAVLEVHDDGPGIAPALLPRLFEPFQTTRKNGTGLGLVSVRAAVSEQGGSVDLVPSELGGACFRVVLISAPAPPEA